VREVLPDAISHREGLEIEKLFLEVRTLKSRASPTGRLLEYLPSLGILIALAGLIWTVHRGIQQQELLRQEEISGRLERAYSKLGSASISERLSGVAQLGV
jgi:hypothetical protein